MSSFRLEYRTGTRRAIDVAIVNAALRSASMSGQQQLRMLMRWNSASPANVCVEIAHKWVIVTNVPYMNHDYTVCYSATMRTKFLAMAVRNW